MTKADLVQEISKQTGIDRDEVLMIVESFMETVKGSLSRGKEVYLRGFGSFIIKRRAEKTGRNIGQNTTLIIPAHDIPAFKPSKEFSIKSKSRNKQIILGIVCIPKRKVETLEAFQSI